MLRWGPGIYPTCVAAVSVRGSRSWLRRQFPAKSTYVRRSDVQGTPNASANFDAYRRPAGGLAGYARISMNALTLSIRRRDRSSRRGGKPRRAGGDTRPASSSLSRDSRSPWQQGRSYGPAPREKSRCGRARVLRRVLARGPAGATSTRHAGKTLPGRSRTKPHVLGRHLGKLHRIPLAAPSSESGSIVIVKVALEKPLVERLARRIPP